MLEEQNRKQCILSMVSAIIVVLCTCTGVVMNLTTTQDQNFDHMGIQTFCMFTVISNILVAMGMSLVIPYTIDGIRKRYFHLPDWLVSFLLSGTVAVTLTFLVSLFILAPFKGFVLIFTGSRFFLHGVGPILSFIAFSFFIIDHHVSILECLQSLIPVFIYACVYYILVVKIGPSRGGWNDFYGFATYLPIWIPMMLILPITFGISYLLRELHNRSFVRAREVKNPDDYSEEYLRNEIAYLAELNAREDHLHSDIVIPRRFIKFLIDSTDSDKTVRDGCIFYLNQFLDKTRY